MLLGHHDFHSCCYLCNGTDLEYRFQVKGYTIVRCRACSFVFVRERPTPAELAEFYRENGPQEMYTDVSNRANINYYYERLRDLITSIKPSGGTLLDVGCSEGQFLDVMHGWQRFGIELEPIAAAKASTIYSDHVLNCTLEEADFAMESFDVITLQDVLDHMPDPLTSLKRCHYFLKPGGLIVVKVHNISCLFARLSGSHFYALLPPLHLSYFNRQTLDLALTKSGFSVLSYNYFAHIMFLRTILFRLSGEQQRGLFHHIFKLVEHSYFGRIRVKKNLHDIITMWAVK